MRHTRLGALAAIAAAAIPSAMMQVVARSAMTQRQQQADRLPESKLNRSRHWDYARTYQEARFISPFPHRPVR